MLDRKLLLGSTVIAGLAAALAIASPSVSWAQAPAAAAPKPPATATEDDETEVEALVVTGSRIKRTEFTSAAPVQVITSEQSSLEGLVDTTEILQQSTVASGSFQWNNQLTGFITNGGPGGNSVSLRGLGEQRTLVLLNGRRAGPAGVSGRVGPFDLNVIPSSLIERVEILKDGASSIYGSDAVAGVVNIITKTNLDGIELSAYGNQSFEGGGEQYRLNGAWGKVFDRGYVNGAVDYYELKALERGDRDDTGCTADYLVNPATGARVDHRGLDGEYKCYNLANAYVSAGGMNLMPISNLPAGFVLPTAAQGNNPFAAASAAGFARWGRAGYPLTYPYAPYSTPLYDESTVLSPVKRTTISINGGYDITPDIEVYGEFLWNRRESEQIGVAQIFQSFAQLNTLYGVANSLPASNPNNPFGVAAQTVTAYKSASYQEVDYTRVVGGIRGTLDIWGGWDWDIYGQYSKSDATYNNGDRVYLDRFAALNAPGTACTNTPLPISPANPTGGNVSNFNCSALPGGIPWASARVLNGQFTDAERAFLFFNEEGTTTYEHKYIEGSVSGNIMTLPAGPLGAAFGFQVREEEIDDQPPPSAASRNMALFSSAGPTKGSDSVREAFAEFSIPVFKGLPGIESFDINLSGRYSDYDSYGSSKTYKVGLNWQITPSWRIRATQGTSFRAPALYEQFLGAQTGYQAQSAVDPCYDYANDPSVSGQVKANCLADGIPDNKTGGSSVTVFSIGGAGVVGPESALARTVGVIWTPDFIDLSVAVDYFEFKVEDEVRQFGASNILNQCYESDNFPNSPYCTLFTRDAVTHDVLTINNAYVNVAEQINRGIDLSTHYRHEFDFGNLTIDTQFTWQLQDTTKLLATAGEEDYNGSTTEPDFTGQINTRFDRGDWTVFWGVDMIGKASDTEGFQGDIFANTRYANIPGGLSNGNCAIEPNYCVYYKQYTEFTAYHDVSVRRRMDDWTFTAGIQNVFDERPPAQSPGQFKIGTAALNLYDMVGRRGFISVTKRW